MSKPQFKTHKMVSFEPQELIDMGVVLVEAADNTSVCACLLKDWGITPERLEVLARKLKQSVERL